MISKYPWPFVIEWDDPRLFDMESDDVDQILMYSYNAQYFVDKLNMSYCEWLKQIDEDQNDNFGFYIEFIRYINCRYGKNGWRYWKQIFMYIKPWPFVTIFRMNDWFQHFQQMADKFIDMFNLIDNEENQNVLKNNGLSDVNITEERNKLMEMMKFADVHSWSAGQLKKSGHVATLDEAYQLKKEKAFQWILQYKHICVVLKNITLSLDFEWSYKQC